METQNARFWRALEKKAKIWMENSSDEPSFVMLYLPKPNKSRPVPQIKFFGSSNMKKFVEDVEVRRKFVEACEKPIEVEEPKKLKVFHPREPDTYTMDNLRILASCLVREEGCSLSHADLGKIIDAYRGYRHLITTNDHQQQQNDALKKLTQKKRRHNCVQSRPRTMDIQEFLQHKNYAEVGRMLSSATWEVFLNLAQVIASMLPKVTERLRSSLEHDKCINVHIPGFIPGYSLTQGDCLFSSLSYLWTGNMNQMVHQFRIGAAAHAALHLEHHLRKLISEGFSSIDDVRMLLESFSPEEVRNKSPETDNAEELLKYILQEEARLTAKPNCYSGPIQVRFLAGYLDQSIQMHSINLLKGYNECIHPCTCQTITKDPVHILWINKAGDEVGHVVPLIPIQDKP